MIIGKVAYALQTHPYYLEVKMHRVILALLLVIAILVGPSLSIVAAAPTYDHTECRYSYPSNFHPTHGPMRTDGSIGDYFSTLREYPGAPSTTVVFRDASFSVTPDTTSPLASPYYNQTVACVGGFWWVHITYDSGEYCDFPSWYGHHPNRISPYCLLMPAAGLEGWALESQIWFDGWYGPDRWLDYP